MSSVNRLAFLGLLLAAFSHVQAGVVIVTVIAGGNVTVQGSDDSDEIRIMQGSTPEIVVRSTSPQTEIQAMGRTFSFGQNVILAETSEGSGITLNMKDGDDDVVMDLLSVYRISTRLGDGTDNLSLSGDVERDVYVDAGRDDDSVDLFIGSVGSNVTVLLGDSNSVDECILEEFDVGGQVRITQGAGGSEVSLIDDSVMRSISTTLGRGNDIVEIESCEIADNLYSNLGVGSPKNGGAGGNTNADQAVTIRETAIGRTVRLYGGNDVNDFLLIDDFCLVGGSLTMSGGSGNDAIEASLSDFFGNVNLTGAAGQDDLRITNANVFGNATLNSGADEGFLIAAHTDFQGNLTMLGGPDDDWIAVGNPFIAIFPFLGFGPATISFSPTSTVTVNAGGGNDKLTGPYDGIIALRRLVALMGSGDDTVKWVDADTTVTSGAVFSGASGFDELDRTGSTLTGNVSTFGFETIK